MRTLGLLLVLALPSVPSPAHAQTPAPAPGTSSAPPQPAPSTPLAAAQGALEPQGYTYNANGRRDPFVSLVRRGTELPGTTTPGQRPPGLAGLSTAEISLRGTLEGRDGFVAMVHGADNKTYLVRTGDRLLDGTVRTITADALVIRQRVSDPLSPDTERDVRKLLRQTVEAK